jgi:ABC-2 type transport system ATP-binding protein
VLLVTHFMEEAEHLCDRLALIDRGRVVAVDTPAGMAERAGGGQRMRFRPSVPLADEDLLALPAVTAVARRGGQFEVDGGPDLVQQVTSFPARRQIIGSRLRASPSGSRSTGRRWHCNLR